MISPNLRESVGIAIFSNVIIKNNLFKTLFTELA